MTSTQDLLRLRFTEACAERDNILAQSIPLRAQRDELARASEAALAVQVEPLNTQIASLEAQLPGLMNELAAIANALGGQTTAPVA